MSSASWACLLLGLRSAFESDLYLRDTNLDDIVCGRSPNDLRVCILVELEVDTVPFNRIIGAPLFAFSDPEKPGKSTWKRLFSSFFG